MSKNVLPIGWCVGCEIELSCHSMKRFSFSKINQIYLTFLVKRFSSNILFLLSLSSFIIIIAIRASAQSIRSREKIKVFSPKFFPWHFIGSTAKMLPIQMLFQNILSLRFVFTKRTGKRRIFSTFKLLMTSQWIYSGVRSSTSTEISAVGFLKGILPQPQFRSLIWKWR